MMCSGDLFQYCGAGGHIILYTKAGTVATTTTTTGSGPAPTPSFKPSHGNFQLLGCYNEVFAERRSVLCMRKTT